MSEGPPPNLRVHFYRSSQNPFVQHHICNVLKIKIGVIFLQAKILGMTQYNALICYDYRVNVWYLRVIDLLFDVDFDLFIRSQDILQVIWRIFQCDPTPLQAKFLTAPLFTFAQKILFALPCFFFYHLNNITKTSRTIKLPSEFGVVHDIGIV